METVNQIIGFVLMIVILSYVFGHGSGRDDTDESDGKRSGLRLYTDHRTGVQYVQGGIFGGLTVRVDAHGKPVTVKPKDREKQLKDIATGK